MPEFTVNYLDHVAIRAKDQQRSADWYEKVLGLTKGDFPEWKNHPVFMGGNNFGIAIFPAIINDPEIDQSSRNSRIDHFAFNVSNEDFEKAKQHYKDLGIEFKFQDHFYTHSIYIKDPDGHVVELTTFVQR